MAGFLSGGSGQRGQFAIPLEKFVPPENDKCYIAIGALNMPPLHFYYHHSPPPPLLNTLIMITISAVSGHDAVIIK